MIDNIFGSLIEPQGKLAQYRESVKGVRHFYHTTPLIPQPGEPFTIHLTTCTPPDFDAAQLLFSLDGSDPVAGPGAQTLALETVSTEWEGVDWGYLTHWKAELPALPANTQLRYHIRARQLGSGRWIYADNQADNPTRATSFTVRIDSRSTPEWAKSALVYHIFVDRFNPGAGRAWKQTTDLRGFCGGTLTGITEKLDYIQSFGFNAIWLSPFFKSTTHHGYNASDYYTVEPRYGTNADLQILIEEAHRRNMRLILDFVANHWSKDHPTFQDAQKNPHSPYHDWYIWKNWPAEYETYFDVKELPKLNLAASSGARQYLLEVAQYWLQQGFDGYRLDYANGPVHDFWVDFQHVCRQVKPEVWIFGEVIHTAAYQRSLAACMHGTLDFLLTRALRETFAFGRMKLSEFEAIRHGNERYFPASFTRPLFLDNHDMGRFFYMAGEDKAKLKLGALILYTLSQPPIVYNGTEAGVSQERPMVQGTRTVFEEARQPMKWGAEQEADLVDYFRRLGELRRRYSVLWQGEHQLVHLDDEQGTYAYLRLAGDSAVLVALNNSPAPRTLQLPVHPIPAAACDRLNSHPVNIENGLLLISLPEYSGALIA